jgi:hypothetical protein
MLQMVVFWMYLNAFAMKTFYKTPDFAENTRCYYLCGEFHEWVKRDFTDLVNDKNVNIIIDSMSKPLPVPLLNSEDILQNGVKSAK